MELHEGELTHDARCCPPESEPGACATFEHAPVGIAHVSVGGSILRVNDALCRLLGYSREALTGLTFQAITYPDDLEADLEHAQRLLRGEIDTFTMEKRYVRGDGAVIWAELSASCVRAPSGDPDFFLAVVSDIEPRKAADAELERLLAEVERQAAAMDAVLSSAPDALLVFGPDGALVRINPQAEALLGPAARVEPSHRLELLQVRLPDGRPLPGEQAAVVRALRGEHVSGELQLMTVPGRDEVWVSVSAAPIPGPGGEPAGVVMTMLDITERQRLQQRQNELLQSISHDLRNPLTTVLGEAQRIQRHVERAETVRRAAGHILVSARRMDAMVRDLVDSARLESGPVLTDLQPLNLAEFVHEVKERLEDIDGAAARVQIETEADLPLVLADAGHLERILGNLLSNALKYSPEDSPVTVRGVQEENRVTVSVSDRGAGISPEDLARLFQPYFRGAAGRRRQDSLGLGLAITRSLIEAQGGRIWVESRPGEGSSFSFTLAIST
jgi:PAS domain S-box-containing protein